MSKDRLVYSTRDGRICPACGRPESACTCRSGASGSGRGDGVVRVRRETAGRGGKIVTAVLGVPADEPALAELAAALKRKCGTGGSIKDGTILIQGDRVDAVVAELQARGYKVKRAGG